MKKILGIFAVLGSIGSWQIFEGIDKMHVRIAKESRERVCACFVKHGLNPSCDLLKPIPVRWAGFSIECGKERATGCYQHTPALISIATLGGPIGQGGWRSTSDLARTLRHEYVHALLDVSGLPPVVEDPMQPNRKDKFMEDCEK